MMFPLFYITWNYFQITLGAGVGLIVYAALAGGDAWKEFSQYFRASKFVCLLYLNWFLNIP
jgi:patatin-like phospholipase/acyl hydrolase